MANPVQHAARHPVSAKRWVRAIQRSLANLATILAAAENVAAQRRQLLRLDDRALKDIGITRAQAEREARRAYWDLPSLPKARR